MAMVAFAMPASATVHEIAGMWCAGERGNPFPPGISGESNADNFAMPLFANGFIKSVEFSEELGGVLISFDFDHPASKIAPHPTVDFFEVEPGVFITAFVLDTSHGFANCKAMRN